MSAIVLDARLRAREARAWLRNGYVSTHYRPPAASGGATLRRNSSSRMDGDGHDP